MLHVQGSGGCGRDVGWDELQGNLNSREIYRLHSIKARYNAEGNSAFICRLYIFIFLTVLVYFMWLLYISVYVQVAFLVNVTQTQ